MLRQLLIATLSLVFSATAFSQVVLINSPASLEGGYNFTNAFDNGWGADLTTDIWTADVAMVEAMTAPTNEGCDSLVNGAELDGKIALVDRGSCNFSLKALNAQNAGAIACVIFNNVAGGPVGMGAGDFAADVVIPVVMLSMEDGMLIKAELANGPVNMTIGMVVFDNDVAIGGESVMRAPYGAIPAGQVGITSFTPAAEITNNGMNTAENPTLNAVIAHTNPAGTSTVVVYDETDSGMSTDTSVAIGLPEYTIESGAGTYSLTYTVTTDSTDDLAGDNTFTTDFVVTDNIYSKGSYDFANGQPNSPNIVRTSTGGSLEFMAGFDFPAASGMVIDSITFFVWHDDGTLEEVGPSNVNAFIYEWNDVNNDSLPVTDELEIVGIGIINAFDDPTASSGYVSIPILDYEDLDGPYIIPDDNKKYFAGIRYEGGLNVRFGMDGNYAQTFAGDYGQFPTGLEFPHIVVTEWTAELKPVVEIANGYYFGNLIYPVSLALTVNELNNVGEVNPEIGSFEVYPNPVSNTLNVETKLAKAYKSVDYTIVSKNGQIISTLTQQVTGQVDNATLNVSQLAAGQYFLNVNTAEGSISKPFTVQR